MIPTVACFALSFCFLLTFNLSHLSLTKDGKPHRNLLQLLAGIIDRKPRTLTGNSKREDIVCWCQKSVAHLPNTDTHRSE